MCVPRLPVDGKKVVEHRITLGTKERDLLQDLSTSYRIKSIAPSVATALTDATALYALATIYEMLTGRDIPGIINPDEAGQIWDAIKNEVRTVDVAEVRIDRASSLVGGLANLLDTFAFVVSGGAFDRFQQGRTDDA